MMNVLQLRKTPVAWLSLGLSMCFFSAARSQDALDTARLFPPSLMNPNESELSLSSLKWRLHLLARMEGTYAQSKDEIERQRARLTNDMKLSRETMPEEIRLADADGRSQLVTRVLQVIFEARLDLATAEAEIAMLEQLQQEAESTADDLSLSMEASAAESEVTVAEAQERDRRNQYQIALQALSKGLVPEASLAEKKGDLEVAMAQLREAKAKRDMLGKRVKAQSAQQLAELRLKTVPLKARLAAAENYLEKFNEAAPVLNTIEALQQEHTLWSKDLALVAGELARLSTERIELEALKSAIEADLKTVKESAVDGAAAETVLEPSN